MIKGREAAWVGAILVMVTVPLWHFVDYVRDRTDSRNEAAAWIEDQLRPDWTIVAPKQLGFDARGLEAVGRRVIVIDLQSAQDMDAVNGVLSAVPSPAVIMVPKWGADARFPGQNVADELNDIARRWRTVKTFGTNPVLVNYSSPNPWGDPAFAVATLK